MVSREFRFQMEGHGLTTAEIHYRLRTTPACVSSMSGRNTTSPRNSRNCAASSTIGRKRWRARCTPCASPTTG